jgi:hypothetical protein
MWQDATVSEDLVASRSTSLEIVKTGNKIEVEGQNF